MAGVIEYIEVQLADIALANRLAHEVLGRSLDELPPQTRRVLGLIETFVTERMQQQALLRSDVRCTRRELRSRCGISDAAIRVHLERLVAMEYVRLVTGKNGQRFEYELLFDGALELSEPQMMGLIEVEALRAARAESSVTTSTSQGQRPHLAPSLQGARTALAGASQGEESATNLSKIAAGGEIDTIEPETARRGSVPRHPHPAGLRHRPRGRAPSASHAPPISALRRPGARSAPAPRNPRATHRDPSRYVPAQHRGGLGGRTMNHERRVEITVELTDAQAWQFAQFLKRSCFSDYRGHATSDEEAYQMINAGERIRQALANQGYAPR